MCHRSLPSRFGSVAALLGLALLAPSPTAAAQGSILVDLPPGLSMTLNRGFTLEGEVGFVEAGDRLWSFSTVTGLLLDPDGLELGGRTQHASPALFPDHHLALALAHTPGGSLFIADVSDPTDLRHVGSIATPSQWSVASSDGVWIGPDRRTGYWLAWTGQRLLSFDVWDRTLTDADGALLPGNVSAMGIAGARAAVTEEDGGRVWVVDLSDPADLVWIGTITLPGASFRSFDNLAVRDDRYAFVASGDGVLYALDLLQVELCDTLSMPGLTGHSRVELQGDTLAFSSGGQLHFVDASDPHDLRFKSHSPLPTEGVVPGGTRAAFTADGSGFALAGGGTTGVVLTFDVASGQPLAAPFPVGRYANFLSVVGRDDRIAVVCPGDKEIWLLHGLFGPALPARTCDSLADSAGCVARIHFAGTPSVSGPEPFLVGAEAVLPGRSGQLFYGFGPARTPFHGDLLCAAPPFKRTPGQSSGGAGAPCSGRFELDFNALVQSGVRPHLMAGVVLYAQYRYRDPASPGRASMSDGLQFVIQP